MRRSPLTELGQTSELEQPFFSRAPLFSIHLEDVGKKIKVLGNRQIPIQVESLRHIPDTALDLLWRSYGVKASYPCPTLGGVHDRA